MKNNKLVLLSLIAIAFFYVGCSSNNTQTQEDESLQFFENKDHLIALHNTSSEPQSYHISDAIQANIDTLTRLELLDSLYEGHRMLKIDGKVHFSINSPKSSVIIYTGLMKLEVDSGSFIIDADNSKPGQSLKVFDGKIIASKSYKSDFANADTLTTGEMILINKDIDLMEKETFDTLEVQPKL